MGYVNGQNTNNEMGMGMLSEEKKNNNNNEKLTVFIL